MTIPESPLNLDDTQPNPILVEQAPNLIDPLPPKASFPAWALLILIVISSVSLIATIALVASRAKPSETIIASKAIILRVDGVQQPLETTLTTVADVLAQESISIGTQDIVIPTSETILQDGMLITVARARSVTLIINGESSILSTPFDKPNEILQQAQITVSDTDRIFVDGTRASIADLANWTVPANEISVQRTYDLTILDEDLEIIFTTTAATIAEALFAADIDIFLTDTVTPDLSTAITSDLTITIVRARPISINVDGTTLETRVQGTTVADALSESGIALIGLDYTIPAMDTVLTPDTAINILRVTEALESTALTIPFETVYQADAALEIDQQQVIQSGQNGTEQFNERVRFENGIEVAREPIGTELLTSPQNQIIAYGTNIVLRTVDTPQGVREYWRVIRAYATSYHPEALGGDSTTAIGMELQKGIIAANPNIIPYRTNVFVPNYGIGMMADTGGARSSPYWIDLGYSDDDWISWSRYVDVYLLTPVPATVDYLLPNFRPLNNRPDN